MNVILVRHTRVKVSPGTCYGQTDVGVSDTFEQEAEQTKSALDAYWGTGHPDAAFTSPLTRARLLAAYCGYSDATPDNRLMEMNMGDWEMQRYDDITDPYLQRWYDDFLHLPTPNGESFPMQCKRVATFLDELKEHGHRRVIVFAHAGVIGAAYVHAGRYSLEEVWKHPVPYGGVVELDFI